MSKNNDDNMVAKTDLSKISGGKCEMCGKPDAMNIINGATLCNSCLQSKVKKSRKKNND
ncbi:MAG: hypothetical protein ACOC5T_05780 [Elusimicrobiota bacterium]